MTKIPTRHMLKLGVGQSFLSTDVSSEPIFLMNHEVGYEYKISQAFSAGVNVSLYGQFRFSPTFVGTVSGNLYGRWYYDMKRRIREGKSANNFSGNFFSTVLERHLSYWPYKVPSYRVGAEFGLQRRFLNHGRLELAVGAYYHKSSRATANTASIEFPALDARQIVNGSEDLLIATRSSLSMAFGDWKSTDKGSTCEILKCDQYVRQQWKVMWPNIALGARFSRATIGVGYERKLNDSPFSLNAQLVNDYDDSRQGFIVNQQIYSRRSFQLISSLELRYYYLQKRKIRTGRGGNNLSGIYAGPHVDYILEKSWRKHYAPGKAEHFGFGLTYGFQKTLFDNFYIDVNSAASLDIFNRRDLNVSLRIGFGLRF